MKPKISIIVPIYNVERYIRKCINSILAQTMENIEIILVNDGSTDNCGTIIDEYAFKDRRVRIIHKSNGGQCSARNAGLDIACGEYIGFVDSDDWVDPCMFEEMYKAAKEKKAEITICGREVYSEDGILKLMVSPPDKLINLNEKNLAQYILDFFFYPHTPSVCNKLYKRDLIEKNKLRFNNISSVGSEDTLFNYIALCKIKRLYSMAGHYYKSTARYGSTARTFRKGEMARISRLLEECLNYSKRSNKLEVYERVAPYFLLYYQQRTIDMIQNVFKERSYKIISEEFKTASIIPSFKYNAKKLVFSRNCSKDLSKKGYRLKGKIIQKIIMLLCLLNLFESASRFINLIQWINRKSNRTSYS